MPKISFFIALLAEVQPCHSKMLPLLSWWGSDLTQPHLIPVWVLTIPKEKQQMWCRGTERKWFLSGKLRRKHLIIYFMKFLDCLIAFLKTLKAVCFSFEFLNFACVPPPHFVLGGTTPLPPFSMPLNRRPWLEGNALLAGWALAVALTGLPARL